jgi:hypothetical protein
MIPARAARWITLSLCLAGLPHTAAAQQTPAGMTIEPIDNGFVISPEFKFTKVDHADASMAGLSGGWVYDHTLVFGAAGYWQTNDDHGPQLSYGGAVVKWLVQDREPLGFSIGALIGGGEARLPTAVTFQSLDFNHPNGTAPTVVSRPGIVNLYDRFFVFEPTADVSVRVASHARLAIGAGYRAIGHAYGEEGRLRGASGTVSLQFFTSPETRTPKHP